MTLIDTADAYGPLTNEELVGRALTGGHRERAVLAEVLRYCEEQGIALLPFAPLERGFLAGEPVGRRVDVVGEDRDAPGRASWCSRA